MKHQMQVFTCQYRRTYFKKSADFRNIPANPHSICPGQAALLPLRFRHRTCAAHPGQPFPKPEACQFYRFRRKGAFFFRIHTVFPPHIILITIIFIIQSPLLFFNCNPPFLVVCYMYNNTMSKGTFSLDSGSEGGKANYENAGIS